MAGRAPSGSSTMTRQRSMRPAGTEQQSRGDGHGQSHGDNYQTPVVSTRSRWAARKAWCRDGQTRLARQLKRRVLLQDRGLKPLQGRARLTAELLDQGLARRLVGGQRLGLPSAAVERDHQLSVQALP